MIIKSNGQVETPSNEIDDILTVLQGLSLPTGARLCSISEHRSIESPEEVNFVLTFEWDTEV